MSAMELIDRGSGFNIVAAKLAIKTSLSVSRVGVKPLARRIEYLAHVVGFSGWLMQPSIMVIGPPKRIKK